MVSFSFYYLRSTGIIPKTETVNCSFEKENKKGINCQILEIKEKGNVLKISDPEVFCLSNCNNPEKFKELPDITTEGKFIQIKFKLENSGKQEMYLGSINLFDDNNNPTNKPNKQETSCYWCTSWPGIIYEGMTISPGFEQETSRIFEVEKNSDNLKLKIFLWKGLLLAN